MCRIIRISSAALILGVAALTGCSSDKATSVLRSKDNQFAADTILAAAEETAASAASESPVAGGLAATAKPLQPGDVPATTIVPGAPSTPSALVNRKIIRNADITIEVEKVPQAVAQLRNLVATTGGFVSSEQATYGSRDQVSLTFRVPVTQFDIALTRLTKIGKVVSTNVSSQEVTAQFSDIEARLKSKKISAARLRELLAKAAKVTDLLEVENELSNREAEIESMQGQLNVLGDQTSLSTIIVQVIGKGESTVVSVPQKQDPSFTRAMKGSLKAIGRMGKGLAAAAGAVLPFLPLVLLLAVLVLVARSRRRRHLAMSASPQTVVTNPAQAVVATPAPASPVELVLEETPETDSAN